MANNKLKGAIVEKGKTFKEVCEAIGMPMTTFSRKINGHVEFTESEIKKLSILLNKSPTDIFFYDCVTERITKTA